MYALINLKNLENENMASYLVSPQLATKVYFS